MGRQMHLEGGNILAGLHFTVVGERIDGQGVDFMAALDVIKDKRKNGSHISFVSLSDMVEVVQSFRILSFSSRADSE